MNKGRKGNILFRNYCQPDPKSTRPQVNPDQKLSIQLKNMYMQFQNLSFRVENLIFMIEFRLSKRKYYSYFIFFIKIIIHLLKMTQDIINWSVSVNLIRNSNNILILCNGDCSLLLCVFLYSHVAS